MPTLRVGSFSSINLTYYFVWVTALLASSFPQVFAKLESPRCFGHYLSNTKAGFAQMANIQQRLPENLPGDFFVDASCIDCDTCSQLAPSVFRDHGEQCSVYHQPETVAETRLALMALVACPPAQSEQPKNIMRTSALMPSLRSLPRMCTSADLLRSQASAPGVT